MRASDFVKCPKTKAPVCECSNLAKLTEAEQTVKAIATLEHTVDDVEGVIQFIQTPSQPTIIKGIVKGLTPGKHGFHIHEFGDLSKGCESAGAHYNPDGVEHGSLEQGHVGDLGNITADQSGTARFQIKAHRVELSDVVGRAVVIHADEDDLGKGGDEESLKTGNAGKRVGCGVIRLQQSVEEAYKRKVSDKHFDRNLLPQIRRPDIQDSPFDYVEGRISIEKIKPVQSQRVDGLDKKAEDVFLNNEDRPFIIDKDNYLINGHHRFDAAHVLGIKKVKAIKIDASIEEVMDHFSHTASDREVIPENYFKRLLQAKMTEDRLPKEVEQFIDELVPTDVGVQDVGDYVVHFEGFTDQCNDGYDDDSIQDVYAEVYQDFDDRQGQQALVRGVAYDDLCVDCNPVLYSVYKKINENFADGKVKGKSRPGRVKRAGASCKGSVSSLRAKAKKYSGEKGKMYHWCANMKAGKKKS